MCNHPELQFAFVTNFDNVNHRNPNFLNWQVYSGFMILLAIILQFNATSCGLGWTYDSSLYMQMSNQLMQNGILIMNNDSFSVKAPLFPLILSLYGTYFHLFYTVIFACSLILGSILIAEWVQTAWLRFIGIASFIFSTPLLMIHSYMWADSLMVLLIFLLLYTLNQYLKRPRLSLMIILSICSALLIQVRFAGIFISLATILFFGINYKTASLKHTSLFVIITFLPIIIWLFLVPGIINFRIDEYQSTQPSDFLHNVFVMADALSLYLLPRNLPSVFRILHAIFLVIFIVGKNHRIIKFSFPLLCMIIFAVYYLGIHLFFRIPMSSSEKYLAPILPLLIIVLFFTLDRLYTKRKVLLLSVCLIWLLYPLSRSIKNSIFWKAKICIENNEQNRPHNIPSVSID